MDEINKIIGKNLHAFRLGAGMSQSELGRTIGVTFQQVQKYEKGQSKVSAALLYKLCGIFRVQLDDFFDRKAVVFSAKKDCLFPKFSKVYAGLSAPKRKLLLEVAKQMDCRAESDARSFR